MLTNIYVTQCYATLLHLAHPRYVMLRYFRLQYVALQGGAGVMGGHQIPNP